MNDVFHFQSLFLFYRTESELLGEIINIVNLVLMTLDKHPLNIKGNIGIDKPIIDLQSLLHQESKYVCYWNLGYGRYWKDNHCRRNV